MSQRNPMNDRYNTDEKKGQTRKSAAKAKPKTKAASSVQIQSTVKTPQQKKAAAKARRQEQATTDRKYYNPPTPEYKKWRKVFWGLIISSMVMIAVSFMVSMVTQNNTESPLAALYWVFLITAYVLMLSGFIVEWVKCRKLRRAYQTEMMAVESREAKVAAKKERAAQAAAKKAAKLAGEELKEAEPAKPEKKGLFSFLTKKKNDEVTIPKASVIQDKEKPAEEPKEKELSIAEAKKLKEEKAKAEKAAKAAEKTTEKACHPEAQPCHPEAQPKDPQPAAVQKPAEAAKGAAKPKHATQLRQAKKSRIPKVSEKHDSGESESQ